MELVKYLTTVARNSTIADVCLFLFFAAILVGAALGH